MLVLDSTVLVAALDRGRTSHQAARHLLSSDASKAVTTQTMREALAVATRPMTANGLGLEFDAAWKSLNALRMACDRLLLETDKWWSSYTTLANTIRPSGRTLYDLGQVAHVHSLGKPAQLLTDDAGMVTRYQSHIEVITIADLLARQTNV